MGLIFKGWIIGRLIRKNNWGDLEMSAIAIITARGGSKRIPKKNIKEFCGKPIIAYSIEAALCSDIFDEVMVSTDSEEIAEVARRYGASVPFMRSAEMSNDFATTEDVIKEVIDEYAQIGRSFDDFCCLYPTAPFVTSQKLKSAYEDMKKKEADSVISVVKYDFPPQRAFVIRNARVAYQYPEYKDARSQDLEPIYHDCGQFSFCKTDVFLNENMIIVENCIPFLLQMEEVQDIDTESDWSLAEMKYVKMVERLSSLEDNN